VLIVHQWHLWHLQNIITALEEHTWT